MKDKFKKEKAIIIKELAKLEELNWAKDKKVADSIFPYVLIEAINLLLNSNIKKTPTDYMKTGESTKIKIKDILEN